MPDWVSAAIAVTIVALLFYWLFASARSTHQAREADVRGAEALQALAPSIQRMNVWIDVLVPVPPTKDDEPDVREQALFELASIRENLLDVHTHRVDDVGRTYTDLWLQMSDVAIEMWQHFPYDPNGYERTWRRLLERYAALIQQGEVIRSVPMGQLEEYAKSTRGVRKYR